MAVDAAARADPEGSASAGGQAERVMYASTGAHESDDAWSELGARERGPFCSNMTHSAVLLIYNPLRTEHRFRE